MKRYGIIVEDVKTGKRISGVKVELTDFQTHNDGFPIYDSGITDEIGLIYLNPPKEVKK